MRARLKPGWFSTGGGSERAPSALYLARDSVGGGPYVVEVDYPLQ